MPVPLNYNMQDYAGCKDTAIRNCNGRKQCSASTPHAFTTWKDLGWVNRKLRKPESVNDKKIYKNFCQESSLFIECATMAQ
jgi:hypothetical protein